MLLAAGKIRMQNFLCPVLTFPETTLCDISRISSPRLLTVLSYAQDLNEELTAEGQHLSLGSAVVIHVERTGFVFCISILVFCMKLNLKHFSSSQNCQKISLKTFMRSGGFFIAKNTFRLYWKSKVLMVMPCNLNSWGGIFRPAINTASFSLSALRWVFKLF